MLALVVAPKNIKNVAEVHFNMRKIKENVYSVGPVDSGVRIFHGYLTPNGSSYNSYLIVDDEITLIDGAKATFTDEHIKNIEEIVPLDKINHIIVNHIEPDHSGSLPEIIKRAPNAKVYSTMQGFKGLKNYYHIDVENAVAVKGNDEITTGKYTLKFIPAPMVHWPDSMLTYLVQEKILFSNDALGQHIGTDKMYDDELGKEFIMARTGDYYANIVLPFGMQVGKLLDAARGLDLELVCPSHGVILRSYINEVIDGYSKWKDNTVSEEAIVIYDTMWNSTKEMAERIARDFEEKGIPAKLLDLKETHYSTAMAELLEKKYIAIGCSTLNKNILPATAAFLAYMRGLAPKGRVGLAFGSYGWSGESISQIEDVMKDLEWEILPQQKRLYMS